jgi:hypothetical protein
MSDEELDELVRRSAEAYPEELPLGNWLRMENRLQEAATERLVRRRLWRFFGLEVLVVALVLLVWQGYRVISPTADPVQQAASQPSAATHLQSANLSATKQLSQPISTSPLSATPRITNISPGSISGSGNILQAENTRARIIKPTVTASSRPAKSETQQVLSRYLLAAKPVSKRRKLATAIEQPQSVLFGDESKKQSEAPLSSFAPESALAATFSQKPADELAHLSFQQRDLAQEFTLPLVLPLSAQDTLAGVLRRPIPPVDSTTQPEKSVASFYRVVIGVAAAPSWSAVRTLNTAQLGGNLGLTLEYRLTTRLRLRTGLVRSVKRYEAASSDYTPLPAWNWRPGNYEVYANCRITEIPLDLRYDMVSKPTYLVFAGAGLTSLLMRHEQYAYDYQVNGQNRTAAAKVVNGSNYAFGLFTISTGVERALGSRWSVQAEPFLELPLGSVGAGKVRLSSAGATFSLKYGLLR